MTRIYLPLDNDWLLALTRTRQLGDVPLSAHAVTESLRRALPAADEEELEYAALCDAVDASARRRDGPGERRMVAAADVDRAWVTAVGAPDGVPIDGALIADADADAAVPESAVWVAHAVPLGQVAAFHVDEAGAADDDELLWYDPTELGTFQFSASSGGCV